MIPGIGLFAAGPGTGGAGDASVAQAKPKRSLATVSAQVEQLVQDQPKMWSQVTAMHSTLQAIQTTLASFAVPAGPPAPMPGLPAPAAAGGAGVGVFAVAGAQMVKYQYHQLPVREA